MKKLLSILAAVGLTATASTAVVACTATIKAKDVKFDNDGNATFTIKNVKLDKGLVLEGVKKDGGEATADADVDHYELGGFFVIKSDKKLSKLDMSDIDDEGDNDNLVAGATFTVDKSEVKVSQVMEPAKTTGGQATPTSQYKLTENKKAKLNVSIDKDSFKDLAGKKVTWQVVRSAEKADEKMYTVIDKVKINVPAAKAASKNAALTLSDAKTNADGTEIDVTVSAALLQDVTTNDIKVGGVSNGAAVKSVDAKTGSTTIKITMDKAVAKADTIKITINGFKTTDALTVSTAAMVA